MMRTLSPAAEERALMSFVSERLRLIATILDPRTIRAILSLGLPANVVGPRPNSQLDG